MNITALKFCTWSKSIASAMLMLAITGSAFALDLSKFTPPKLEPYKISKACATLLKKPGTLPTPTTACNPFRGDQFHATEGWPGVISFQKNEVTLAPMGAQPIEATYHYTVGVSHDGHLVGQLSMQNRKKESSKVLFDLSSDGRTLTLMYPAQSGKEVYQRLTAKEAAAQQEALRKVLVPSGVAK